MTTIITHPAFLRHETGTHPERPERLVAIRDALEGAGLRARCRALEPRPATVEEVARVHEASVIERARRLAEAGGGRIDWDTVVSAGSFEAALLAAGGAIEGARVVLDGEDANAFALARPPGHHATSDRSMGFCLFNNVAVAAQWAIDTGRARRVAIFDPDVHHGNGTQDIFYDRADVLYLSIHQSPLYPGTGFPEEAGEGRGLGYTMNLPVPPGTGESDYRALVRAFVLPALRSFAPDLLIVSAGFDAHVDDPLGNLRLGTGYFGELYRDLVGVCPRLVACLEGGYNVEALGASVAEVTRALLGDALDRADPVPASAPLPAARWGEYRAHLGRFWPNVGAASIGA